MSKILSIAIVVLFGVYIVKSVKNIIESIKAKKAQKGEQKDKRGYSFHKASKGNFFAHF